MTILISQVEASCQMVMPAIGCSSSMVGASMISDLPIQAGSMLLLRIY